MKTLSKIILVLFLCVAVDASAQNSKSRIGFKALPGFTTTQSTAGSSPPEIKGRFTFNFGVTYLHTIKDSLTYIETGIYYVDRGVAWKGYGVPIFSSGNFIGGQFTDLYIHQYYISIPILFRKEFKPFFFAAGVMGDYYWYTKFLYSPPLDDVSTEYYYGHSKKLSNNLKLGIALNIGTQIKISERTKLFFEGNFHASNISIRENGDIGFFMNYLLGTGLTFKL